MNKKDLELFQQKLLTEKDMLVSELNSVGQKDPNNAKGWQATTADIEVDSADENEVADKFEEYEGNSGIITKLEEQLKEVNDALDRIEKGIYGICSVCGKPIERGRLEANPSSRTSIIHEH